MNLYYSCIKIIVLYIIRIERRAWMEPREAYYSCFEENLEKLTKLDEMNEYQNCVNKMYDKQAEILSALKQVKTQSESMELMENYMDCIHAYMQIRERAIHSYAFKSGIKVGLQIKEY